MIISLPLGVRTEVMSPYYNAEDQMKYFRQVSSCHFYSLLIEGSVDKGWVMNELKLILCCSRDGTLQEMKPYPVLLCIRAIRKRCQWSH